MDYSGHLDAGSLFSEINAVFKKYGVGKGVGFIPNRLEITMDRADSGLCSLKYREFFTYLPADVLELARENAVEFLGGLGVPHERISKLEQGVEVTLEGDSKITYFPILEMLIQDRTISQNIDAALDSLKESLRSLTTLFELAWRWDRDSEALWRNTVAHLTEVIEANPRMQAEIEEIVRRHSKKV